MNEMIQESWIPEAQDVMLALRRPSRRAPITDILAWTECFALMAAVIAGKFPDKAPQLFAYLRRIVHAAQNFQGSAWVAYDRLYRRRALARHSLDWAQEDSALYNEVFVGHAKAITRCHHCLSKLIHTSESCPEFQQPWGPWPPEYAMSMVPLRFYRQDHTRRHAGSSMRTDVFCGGAGIFISAPSAASHTQQASVQSPLPA